ncbi:MAG: hypothetical protein WBH35_05585 [Bacillota bacterium]|jgi:hypothetical protein|nr:hypothetical protein [Bacillota bacterium]HOB91018.1 hypothetical protein [Bacillota bacterium]HPZ54144.1 hypothetical protein [Bacillota bacterium]HQD18066.1 hypothetical protein [Bacillota bacterium]
MKSQWKLLLTGGAIGALLGGYAVRRMNGHGRRLGTGMPLEMQSRSRITGTVADLAAQAADRMDDLSLRARALNRKVTSGH